MNNVKTDNNDSIIDKNIKDIAISDEMEKSFIDYSMSVIVSRAIPDARDGLKPVHRRILYAMNGLDMQYNKSFKKSARAVGEVIAKYHPHGDASVYDALVRLAQPFSMRYPLIRGQGNFGSVDGDSAAAMRYTEAKLEKISSLLLEDITKNTVDFQENYDGSETEPKVLPGKFPNLLVNGSTGIAVGMSTSIPPHNVKEILEATKALINNPSLEINELLKFVKAPDFPTGGIIINKEEIPKTYLTGRGRIVVRAKTEIVENDKGHSRIIVTEIPYMINKSNLILKIADLVRNKNIESISDIRDESSRKGMRIVIKLKKGYLPEVELNKLFKLTALQSTFPVNLLAIVDERPELLNLKTAILAYINHQMIILIRRSKYELEKAQKRKHILEGLEIALNNINAVISTIRASKTNEIAVSSLMSKFKLDQVQAKAILDMRLQRLTGLERENLLQEIKELDIKIDDLEDIIKYPERRNKELIKLVNSLISTYGDKRRTEVSPYMLNEINEEDLIPQEDVLITVSDRGYVKRLPIDAYRRQNRGGQGSKGTTVNEGDQVKSLIIANTHTDLLLFSSLGKVYRLRAHQIPQKSKNAKGIPFINLININKDEKILSILAVENYENSSLIFVTKKGIVKKTDLKEYELVRKTGKIAIGLRENDELFKVKIINDQDNIDIILGNSNGKAVRFSSKDIRKMGRTASGVKGMNIQDGEIVGYSWANIKNKVSNNILSISELGFGKITKISEYRRTNRGAKGVKTINTEKAGKLVSLLSIKGDEDLVIITNKGTTIRISLGKIKHTSRNTKGVTLVKLKEDEKIVSVTTAKVEEEIAKTVEQKIIQKTEKEK